MKSYNWNTLKGDLQGGASSSIVNLLQSIPYGLIAFAPLGPEYANIGIISSIIGASFAGFFASFLGGSPLQITAPNATTSLIFSYLIIHLMDAHLFNSTDPNFITQILVYSFLTVFLSGVFQLLFGIFYADYLIKFISYPIIAGITTGAGILIFKNALWHILGIAPQDSIFSIWHHFGEIKYGNLLVGVITTLLILYKSKIVKGAIGFPITVGLGVFLYYALFFLGVSKNSLGSTFDNFSFYIPHEFNLFSRANLNEDKYFLSNLITVTPLALNLAILCSLQALLSSLSLKNVSETPNSRKELIGQGVGNIIAGSFGGLLSSGTFGRGALNHQEGGKTKFSGMICSALTLLLAFLVSPVIQYLPVAVITGIVIVLGLNSIDAWTVHLFWGVITRKIRLSADVLGNLSLVLIVITLMLAGYFIQAIGIGVTISILFFLIKMRGALIKRIYEDTSIPTKKIDDENIMKFLTQHHHEIKILELGGFIYFGSAEKLENEIEALADSGVNYVILEMKEINEIDLTGARLLETTYQNLRKKGKYLGFSYLSPASSVWPFLENIRFFDIVDKNYIFEDTDHALQFFEDLMLQGVKRKTDEVEIEFSHLPVFNELLPVELKAIKNSLSKLTFKKDEVIFSEGDKADAMFFIAKGSIDVLINVGEKGLPHTKRIQSLSSGTFFGEMALFQKGFRTATVIATSDLICYKLSYEDYQNLVHGSTHVSVSLLTNIIKILSKRLQFINRMISEMEW